RRLAQGAHQRLFAVRGQFGRVDHPRLGQRRQQLLAARAGFMIDKVQLGGRDLGRLSEPERA
ncbi:hypothetical protein VB636_01280, partial [Paracoccus sp. APAP_BH8]|uniref:hypothetical protein n=1 Tax=Paracoccus sp. APAP_BH8 TaxID=3110237 RepID=UPI002FD86C39